MTIHSDYTGTKEYSLITYDFTPDGYLRPDSLMEMFIDASTVHFTTVFRKYREDLLKQDPARQAEFETFSDAVWVLLGWDIRLLHPLTFQDPTHPLKITVSTRPVYMRRFLAYRTFSVYHEGRLIATAMTKWSTIDNKTRSVLSIPPFILEAFGVDKSHTVAPSFPRLDFETDAHESESESVLATHTHRTLFSDTDLNRHVNNISYYRWVIDALGYPFNRLYYPRVIRILYKKEMSVHSVARILVQSASAFDSSDTVYPPLSLPFSQLESESSPETGSEEVAVNAVIRNAETSDECVKMQIVFGKMQK